MTTHTDSVPNTGAAQKPHQWQLVARVVVYLLGELGRNSLWFAGAMPELAGAPPGEAWPAHVPAGSSAPGFLCTSEASLHDQAVRQAWRQRGERW